MWFKDTPRCDSDAQLHTEKMPRQHAEKIKTSFLGRVGFRRCREVTAKLDFCVQEPIQKILTLDLDENPCWWYREEPTPRRDCDEREPIEETAKSCTEEDAVGEIVDLFIRQQQAVVTYVCQHFADIEFDERAAYQKQKLAEKIDGVRKEVFCLRSLRLLFMMSWAPAENSSEKTTIEKVLEAVSICWMTAKQVCFLVYPLANMSTQEQELALKKIRMRLLRLSGGKKKRGRPRGKLVWRIESKSGILYLISQEGINRLQFLREERIKAEKSKALNEQMRAIVKPVEDLVLEIEQMQTLNAEAVKRLVYSAVADYLYRTLSATVRTLTHRLVADRKEIVENKNDSRIDSFVMGINELLEIAATQVSISDNLCLARELQKLVRGQNA